MMTPAQCTGPRHSPGPTLSSPRPAHSPHSSAQRRHMDTGSAVVMMVQCRHCSYSRLKLSVCTLRILPTLPLMLPWKKSDHPEMYSVSSSEFAVALSSMSHSLTVTSVTTLIPSPMSESVTGTIWRLGRDRFCLHTLENIIL